MQKQVEKRGCEFEKEKYIWKVFARGKGRGDNIIIL